MIEEGAGITGSAHVQRVAARPQLGEAKSAGGIGRAVAEGPAGDALRGLRPRKSHFRTGHRKPPAATTRPVNVQPMGSRLV